MMHWRLKLVISAVLMSCSAAFSEPPPKTDYCQRLQQEIQGKKHGFLAGNLAYYVGGFHASWKPVENETIGLTHPFHHDLRSRGVGIVPSQGQGHDNTGLGNDYSGWEFYKDTRVLYGSVVIEGNLHSHPVPKRMYWRPDRMICEYEVDGVRLREQKFIASNDAACSVITASSPVTLRFNGQSFYGRHSQTSSATIAYAADHNAIHIVEGGTTRCQPETDGAERIGPIMYQGMSTVLTASRSFAGSHAFSQGQHGERQYEFEVPCDRDGVVLVWAMHDRYGKALDNALAVLGKSKDKDVQRSSSTQRRDDFRYKDARHAMIAKTQEMNRQLNEEIPYFRCSDRTVEDIYYYLWSLYLMYYIDVQEGWEMEPHTQTAVNNFLGIHRYDATFQIRVGSWTKNQAHYAYGNVLTWKHLFANGQYRKTPNGLIMLADNKGKAWHSGAYGAELSEHVLGAWQIYEHTGDVQFLRDCYEGYFREVFHNAIGPFFSNQFEVAQALISMAQLTGHAEDIPHWEQLVTRDKDQIRKHFDHHWNSNGNKDYFGGPPNGMLMTTGFWNFRSRDFPREYAHRMTQAWALDRKKGFFGDFFPLAMSRQAMTRFATDVDHSFGYTPDTAYFTLDGMFRQRLGKPAWQLTLNHLKNYNFSQDWNLPVAPEAYTRSGNLFGDQYSNFNAGKLLLILEGLAGLEYCIPEDRLVVHDTMPADWQWMEVRVPIQKPGEKTARWPVIRFERSENDDGITKSIRVTDCPLRVTIEPWSEERAVNQVETQPVGVPPEESGYPHYSRFQFDRGQPTAQVQMQLK